jgi:hypothetical protein
MMRRVWRNRQWLRGALSEIGCGLLTVLFVTIPLWVFTAASRGPGFALLVMLLMLLAMIGMVAIGRILRKK